MKQLLKSYWFGLLVFFTGCYLLCQNVRYDKGSFIVSVVLFGAGFGIILRSYDWHGKKK